MKKEFYVGLEEAFNHGQKEGLKDAFKEILELQPSEFKFLKAYVLGRLKSVEDTLLIMKQKENDEK